MKTVNYILVNEKASKNTQCDITYRDVPKIGHCVVCDASSKFKVPGSSERAALIGTLVKLRKHWPEAHILGMSELDTSSKHAPVRVSEAMNQLRRQMSDLP